MRKFYYLKTLVFTLCILTSAITLYSLFSKETSYKKPVLTDEKFDESLLTINSCARLDSLVIEKFKQSNFDTAKTVLFIDNFLRNRFYHSYSEISIHTNWMAFLLGKFIWRDFLYPVVPSRIIQYPMAACSQQGILFQDQLHKLKIPYETIALKSNSIGKGHYAVSVFYANTWHFYDTNQEPIIIDSTMPSIEKIIDEKLYEKMYVSNLNITTQEMFKTKSFTKTNKNVYSAKNMYLFQKISLFLSDWLWLFLLLLSVYLFRKNKQAVNHS